MEDKIEPNYRTDLSALPDKLMVAAIDFGTTFSGWGYSFKHEFKSDPTNIHAKNWNNGTNISSKAPTAVLIKPDGKTFEAFGYEAEDKYAELCADGEHRDWYFFNRFKMMLHDNLKIEENILLEDATGKSLPAKDVFTHAIKFLKEDLKTVCALGITEDINESEVLWVLTVPAIWNEIAKRFMRQAAEAAGISGSNLKIALEPEAASLFCKMIAVQKTRDADVQMSCFSPGAKYMIVDAGGGTVDISAHEVLEDGFLKELHRASGGAWGGTKIDEEYRQFLINIFGNAVFNGFKEDNMDDFIDIFRAFEVKKRRISKTSSNDTVITVPNSLIEAFTKNTGNELKMAISSSNYSPFVVVEKGNKLRVKASLMRGLFTETIDKIKVHISELLQHKGLSGVDTILMVGGLSDCKLLQETVQQSFSHLKVIIPRDAALTVLKGAVIFGYQPTIIVERILQYTYGIKLRTQFQDNVHQPDKLLILNGKRFCKDYFGKLVESGRAVKLTGQTELELKIRPFITYGMTIHLYGSRDSSPVYVTDKNCFKIGSYEIYFDQDVPENRTKEYSVSGLFGETEIVLAVKDQQTNRNYIGKYVLPKI